MADNVTEPSDGTFSVRESKGLYLSGLIPTEEGKAFCKDPDISFIPHMFQRFSKEGIKNSEKASYFLDLLNVTGGWEFKPMVS